MNAAVHLQYNTCAASGGSWVAQQPLHAAPPTSPRTSPRRAAKAPATGNATATPAAPAAADGTGTADGRAAMASSFVLGGSSTQQDSLEPISEHEAETQRRGGRVNAMLNNAAVSTASVSVASLKEVMTAIGWYVRPRVLSSCLLLPAPVPSTGTCVYACTFVVWFAVPLRPASRWS